MGFTASNFGDKIDVSEIATGTDGELLTWDASGNPTTVAVGTANQVLTSNGAGAAPTFQAASGASLDYTYSADLVSDANLDLTGEETIDGVLTSASTVLCIAQTAPAENGVYTTGAGAWTRIAALDSDADLADWISNGIEVQIGTGGTEYGMGGNGGLRYRISPDENATTLGTDALDFGVVPGEYVLDITTLGADTAQIQVSNIPPILNADLIWVFDDISGSEADLTSSMYLLMQSDGSAEVANYDSARNYSGYTTGGVYASTPNCANIPGGTRTAGYDGWVEIKILNFANGGQTHYISKDVLFYTAAYGYLNDYAGVRLTTGAIDQIRIISDAELASAGTGEIVSGARSTLTLYVRE